MEAILSSSNGLSLVALTPTYVADEEGLPWWLSVKESACQMQETWVQSLGRKDLLEEEMATHSCILTWRIPWTEEPGRLQSMGSQRVGHD